MSEWMQSLIYQKKKIDPPQRHVTINRADGVHNVGDLHLA